jgi:hypothetical protein
MTSEGIMAAILKFSAPTDINRKKPPGRGGPAKVIIFPGVRYEKLVPPRQGTAGAPTRKPA